MAWQAMWQIGTILVIQTGFIGLVGRMSRPLSLPSPLYFRHFGVFRAYDSIPWTCLVSMKRCCLAKLCCRFQKMVNILPGRLFTNQVWPRGQQCQTGRFGLRLILTGTLVNMWRVIFSTMVGGCWLARWNSIQVRILITQVGTCVSLPASQSLS